MKVKFVSRILVPYECVGLDDWICVSLVLLDIINPERRKSDRIVGPQVRLTFDERGGGGIDEFLPKEELEKLDNRDFSDDIRDAKAKGRIVVSNGDWSETVKAVKANVLTVVAK